MISTLIDLLCHRAPYFNREDYVAKVMADIITAYNSTDSAGTYASQPKRPMKGMGRQEQ